MNNQVLKSSVCRVTFFSLAMLLAFAPHCPVRAADGEQLVFVGTYTRGTKSEGIYVYRFNPQTGTVKQVAIGKGVDNPSFVAVHPTGKFLYAVGETGDYRGNTGAVAAFEIDKQSGALTHLNDQSSEGSGPCHIVVDKLGKTALVANYGGGSVASLPIGDDGRLGKAVSAIQHSGSSKITQRQAGPHAHSINVDPANRFACAADLGLDKVLIYRLDPATSKLTANDPPFGSVVPGSGPRHFAFHPSGKYAYVINELNCTITTFSYDGMNGNLTELQTLTTLPVAFQQGFSTAEVQVHSSGKFVYGSNRGHNSIAIFSVDETTGKLTAVGHESTQGKTPRNFGLDLSGKFLFAANQGSDSIVLFRIDQGTGKLTPTDTRIEVPAPVCVKFLNL